MRELNASELHLVAGAQAFIGTTVNIPAPWNTSPASFALVMPEPEAYGSGTWGRAFDNWEDHLEQLTGATGILNAIGIVDPVRSA